MGNLIRARALHKSFGSFEAVRGIDFEVSKGEAFGFLGPNGAGKSSTMRMVGAVSPPSSGELKIFGLDPITQGPQIRARLGVVPQQEELDDLLSVMDNLIVYGRYFNIPMSECKHRAKELLEFVQLTDRSDSRVAPLSGGMKRRVTIARSLMNNPEMLLLDEPTTGLDPQARHLLWERLYRLKSEGVTLVLTTHYMDEAEQLCDRLVIMDQGKIAAEGTPLELIKAHSTPEVLELRLPADQEIDLIGIGESNEILPDRVLIYSASGETALNQVHERGIRPTSVIIRRSSLEDVFLRLTGRTLVE